MGQEVIVKSADTLIRIVAPLDVGLDAVIDASVTVTAKFYDEDFDGEFIFADVLLTEDFGTSGALVADVPDARAFHNGDKVFMYMDDGEVREATVVSKDTIENTITLDLGPGIGGYSKGSRLRTYEIGIVGSTFLLGSKWFDKFLPGDVLVVSHGDGTEDELVIGDVLVWQRFTGYSLIFLDQLTVPITPGTLFKKKLGSTLTGFALYGATPSLTGEDWGWSAVLTSDGDVQDNIRPGMRVRCEAFFTVAGEDLDGRYSETYRVVKGG